MLTEDIAKICHEANSAYCVALGDPILPWDAVKDSVIDGVNNFLNHPEITPEQSHDNWLIGKLLDGWIYGEVKDLSLKTHPCLVEYSKLPEAQKVKDQLFLSICRVLSQSKVKS